MMSAFGMSIAQIANSQNKGPEIEVFQGCTRDRRKYLWLVSMRKGVDLRN